MRYFFSIFFLSFSFFTYAQYEVQQVIIANGGIFGDVSEQVTIGTYNPKSKAYSVFDTVKANSVSDVLIDDHFAFVVADSFLLKYNIDDYSRVAKRQVNGARKIALYQNQVILTRGYGAKDSFLMALNKSDLSIKKGYDISGYAEGVVVAGDTAYVSVPGDFFVNSGNIAIVDLNSEKVLKELKLDTLGNQIGELFYNGDKIRSIYGPYGKSYSLSFSLDPQNEMVSFGTLPKKNIETYGFVDSFLFYYADADVYKYYSGLPVQNIKFTHGQYKVMANDTINHLLYFTTRSFTSAGWTFIYDYDGQKLDSFQVGISPDAIAIDYRIKSTGISEEKQSPPFHIFPNPASENLYFNLPGNQELTALQVFDMKGELVYESKNQSGNTLNLKNLPRGLYLLNAKTQEDIFHQKFIKR